MQGKQGRLRGRTFSAPRKWARGKGRITCQFGCCYNYAIDSEGRKPGEGLPSALTSLPFAFASLLFCTHKPAYCPPFPSMQRRLCAFKSGEVSVLHAGLNISCHRHCCSNHSHCIVKALHGRLSWYSHGFCRINVTATVFLIAQFCHNLGQQRQYYSHISENYWQVAIRDTK